MSTKTAGTERCSVCGATLGRGEQAFLHGEKIRCARCHAKSEAHGSVHPVEYQTVDAEAGKADRRWAASFAMRSMFLIGMLMALTGIFGFYFGAKEEDFRYLGTGLFGLMLLIAATLLDVHAMIRAFLQDR